MNFELARFHMIEQQIRPWQVLDPAILNVLGEVKREDFVPAAHKTLAFADLELPLTTPTETAAALGHCMLSPKVEARMLQDMALTSLDKVLEVGTGSGHMAALMGKQAQRVITIEISPELAETARQNLQRSGIHNVEVRSGDGSQGAAVDGPFDVIVLSGSVAEVPHRLLEQLRPGGRLMAVVGDLPIMRATRITQTGPGQFVTDQGWDTVAPRLQHFAELSRFAF
jgi:protein-L-isoaspartate(D-aspartate) O-methyltransferase